MTITAARRTLETLCCPHTEIASAIRTPGVLSEVRALVEACEALAAALPWGSDLSTSILDRCNVARARWGI